MKVVAAWHVVTKVLWALHESRKPAVHSLPRVNLNVEGFCFCFYFFCLSFVLLHFLPLFFFYFRLRLEHAVDRRVRCK